MNRKRQHDHTMKQFQEVCNGTNCNANKATPHHSAECEAEHDSCHVALNAARENELHAAQEADELRALNARFKYLLKQIAYPRRGTEEDRMDIFDAAKLIQDNFTAEELGCDF
jgi:hypothetical protein